MHDFASGKWKTILLVLEINQLFYSENVYKENLKKKNGKWMDFLKLLLCKVCASFAKYENLANIRMEKTRKSLKQELRPCSFEDFLSSEPEIFDIMAFNDRYLMWHCDHENVTKNVFKHD